MTVKSILRASVAGLVFVLPAAPADAAEKTLDCHVAMLRVNAERFFVRCEAGKPGSAPVREIPYFSAPYSQQNARYLFELALKARDTGQALRLIYEDDPAMNPPGCVASNCRRIIAAGLSAP